MKKLIALLMAMVLPVTLTACVSENEEINDSQATTTSKVITTTTTAFEIANTTVAVKTTANQQTTTQRITTTQKPTITTSKVVTPTTVVTQESNYKIVYITATGKKYHSTQYCSGLSNAKSIYESTIAEAKNKNLTPCSKCY